jgi:predicted nucleic acid-binding Zn ribbon protein
LKDSNEQSLKEIINELLKAYKLEDGINETRLISSWERIAGLMVSNHTERIYIRKNKLYIKLDSPALKHELSFAKSKLIKSLNKVVNKNVIDDIVFL